MMMVKELSKFRQPFSELSAPGDEKETYDKVGQITKYRSLQRQVSVGCSRTVPLPYKLW